jgi:hypothetical protein
MTGPGAGELLNVRTLGRPRDRFVKISRKIKTNEADSAVWISGFPLLSGFGHVTSLRRGSACAARR